jgi:hypothetical protein
VTLLLRIAQWYVPMFLKKSELRRLIKITADAFECTLPSTIGLSIDDTLTTFAQFTRTVVEQPHTRTAQSIQDQLFQSACDRGSKYRRIFRISTLDEAMEAGKVIYKILGIDFQGDTNGQITIRSCFFSKHYSAQTCKIISSLDAGLMAGLSGGSTLKFSQRITEGSLSCKAALEIGGLNK